MNRFDKPDDKPARTGLATMCEKALRDNGGRTRARTWDPMIKSHRLSLICGHIFSNQTEIRPNKINSLQINDKPKAAIAAPKNPIPAQLNPEVCRTFGAAVRAIGGARC